MIKAQRQRGRRRAPVSVIGIVAAAVGLIVGLAGPAFAASVAEVLDTTTGESAIINGAWPGSPARDQRAGLFDLRIDGEVDAQAYCIDINTPVHDGDSLDEVDWETAGVDNLAKVEAILRHYYPNGDGPEGQQITGSDAQKAAATQAAIWHYTDEYALTDDDSENDPVVIANYKVILEAVEGGLEGFGEPTVSLSITPPESTSGEANGLVGPYLVNTSADEVTLTPSDGVTLHNEDGSPFTGTVVDGTQIWLSSSAVGDGSIAATASAEVGAGRVFFTQGVQRLVLASTITTDATADAPVSFTAAPTTTTESTTTTTAPSTTSTTVPITVQSTVPDAPTTTVPITPNQGEGGGLPVTGAQSLMLVAVAAVLLAAGAGFGIVSRRKRLEGVEE
jgi:TQXA domain-containing protein/LPXTG-motif cell wall-anchored protein